MFCPNRITRFCVPKVAKVGHEGPEQIRVDESSPDGGFLVVNLSEDSRYEKKRFSAPLCDVPVREPWAYGQREVDFDTTPI